MIPPLLKWTQKSRDQKLNTKHEIVSLVRSNLVRIELPSKSVLALFKGFLMFFSILTEIEHIKPINSFSV